MNWIIYIIECRDHTLYTGITNDLELRLKAHEKGLGAKYTKGRGPFILRYKENAPNRSVASKREQKIKNLNKEKKLQLCSLS